LDQIVAELQQCAGTQFDPAIADVFVKVARRRGDIFAVNSARDIV
jgi:HD-GYP domain-containing protein (c-di-GMP phosphodiesterase class II)